MSTFVCVLCKCLPYLSFHFLTLFLRVWVCAGARHACMRVYLVEDELYLSAGPPGLTHVITTGRDLFLSSCAPPRKENAVGNFLLLLI